ncbi:unnamed protein product, partial [Iphiclides podalirius]
MRLAGSSAAPWPAESDGPSTEHSDDHVPDTGESRQSKPHPFSRAVLTGDLRAALKLAPAVYRGQRPLNWCRDQLGDGVRVGTAPTRPTLARLLCDARDPVSISPSVA